MNGHPRDQAKVSVSDNLFVLQSLQELQALSLVQYCSKIMTLSSQSKAKQGDRRSHIDAIEAFKAVLAQSLKGIYMS